MVGVVEGWRGIAAIMVVYAHWGQPLEWPLGPLKFSFTGVDLFFVLSGFVFSPMILKNPPASILEYGRRRFTRIYPAYFAALMVYIFLAWWDMKPLVFIPEHLLMAHLQSREMAFHYNPAFWSLPSEVSFYALVPVLGWIFSGLAPGMKKPKLFLLALLIFSAFMRWILTHAADEIRQNLSYVLMHHLPGLLVEFGLGMLVWQVWHERPKPRPIFLVAGLIGWYGLAEYFVWMLSRGTSPWVAGQLSPLAAACFAAMLLGSLPAPGTTLGRWPAWLANWGGRLSYSVYLLHMAWLAPTLAWVQQWGVALGSLLGAIGLILSSLLLNGLIEEPARRWGRRLKAGSSERLAASAQSRR